MNTKQTGKVVAAKASKVLASNHSSTLQKSLAGSVLSQRNTSKTTGKRMETKASNSLKSNRCK